MSLFSKYVKERFNWETIEVESGFITYALAPPDAMIKDFYVEPELRGTSLAKRLADQAFRHAHSAGCKTMWAEVQAQSKGSTHALKTNLHYGFKLSHTEGESIILKKVID